VPYDESLFSFPKYRRYNPQVQRRRSDNESELTIDNDLVTLTDDSDVKHAVGNSKVLKVTVFDKIEKPKTLDAADETKKHLLHEIKTIQDKLEKLKDLVGIEKEKIERVKKPLEPQDVEEFLEEAPQQRIVASPKVKAIKAPQTPIKTSTPPSYAASTPVFSQTNQAASVQNSTPEQSNAQIHNPQPFQPSGQGQYTYPQNYQTPPLTQTPPRLVQTPPPQFTNQHHPVQHPPLPNQPGQHPQLSNQPGQHPQLPNQPGQHPQLPNQHPPGQHPQLPQGQFQYNPYQPFQRQSAPVNGPVVPPRTGSVAKPQGSPPNPAANQPFYPPNANAPTVSPTFQHSFQYPNQGPNVPPRQ
jgi:hypothetical protein